MSARGNDAWSGSGMAAMQRSWDGGILALQKCGRCDHIQFPPTRLCSACHSQRLVLEEASGRGTLLSFSEVHRAAGPEFDRYVPYTVVVVKLDEGPLIESWLVTESPKPGGDIPEIGDSVRVFIGVLNGRNLPLVRSNGSIA